MYIIRGIILSGIRLDTFNLRPDTGYWDYLTVYFSDFISGASLEFHIYIYNIYNFLNYKTIPDCQ